MMSEAERAPAPDEAKRVSILVFVYVQIFVKALTKMKLFRDEQIPCNSKSVDIVIYWFI